METAMTFLLSLLFLFTRNCMPVASLNSFAKPCITAAASLLLSSVVMFTEGVKMKLPFFSAMLTGSGSTFTRCAFTFIKNKRNKIEQYFIVKMNTGYQVFFAGKTVSRYKMTLEFQCFQSSW